MNSKLRCIFLFLLLFSVFYLCEARGGGGRGGRGRGRGRSGSRGGVRAKSTSGSRVRGSSSYYGGVRSGTSGIKVGSKTSSMSGYGSSGFRNTLLNPRMHTYVRTRSGAGHPFVIIAATAPILYDERNYYWSFHGASYKQNLSNYNIVCEYVFGNDDKELQNITFSNGTEARSIFFRCEGSVECCGMYCCFSFGQYRELLFVLGFCSLIAWIAYYAKKREPIRDEKSADDVQPLKKKSSKPKGKSPPKPLAILPQNNKPSAPQLEDGS